MRFAEAWQALWPLQDPSWAHSPVSPLQAWSPIQELAPSLAHRSVGVGAWLLVPSSDPCPPFFLPVIGITTATTIPTTSNSIINNTSLLRLCWNQGVSTLTNVWAVAKGTSSAFFWWFFARSSWSGTSSAASSATGISSISMARRSGGGEIFSSGLRILSAVSSSSSPPLPPTAKAPCCSDEVPTSEEKPPFSWSGRGRCFCWLWEEAWGLCFRMHNFEKIS